ncbi:MAG: hypothetical protein HC892_15210 [Saprospiraceae bacterium]|nr:hypothetical protein [Saprospiraceae bacterium]
MATNADLLTERGVFGTTSRDPQPFGNNNDNDRLLTIAESDELLDYLIKSFHLYKHYDIDSTSRKAPHYIRLHLRDLYVVQKTKRDALQLSIEDKDPVLAANMANAAREKIDAINLNMAKQVQLQQISTIEQNNLEKEKTIQKLRDSIQSVRSKYSIYNVSTQSESLSELLSSRKTDLIASKATLEAIKASKSIKLRDTIILLDAHIQGLEKELEQLLLNAEDFNEGMPLVEDLQEQYGQAIRQVTYDKERLKQLQTSLNSALSSVILVEQANVSVIKSRPNRAILVIASVAAAFIFSVLGVLVFDTYKDTNWKAIWKDSTDTSIE